MALLKARVTLPYTTGIPRDCAVNDFSFTAAAGKASTIADALDNFYNLAGAGQTERVAYYLSSHINRGGAVCKVEVYNQDDLPPRRPIFTKLFTLGAAATGDNLPLECAVTASFQGPPLSGIPQARRRGRIFVGPLKAAAIIASGTSRPTVSSGIRNNLTAACKNLSLFCTAEGISWGVKSQVSPSEFTAITNGWVDDEMDTMRKRQGRATSRTTWTL